MASEDSAQSRKIIPSEIPSLREIVPEAIDASQPSPSVASPVCYAREAGDLYAGYATREELLALLNELLEAECEIARKLREILPRIRDDAMHADFSGMLKGHDENIARTNAELQRSSAQ